MTPEDAIYQILKNEPTITSKVDGRIWGGTIPQDVVRFPGIVYRADGNFRTVATLQGGVSLIGQRFWLLSVDHKYSDSADVDYAVILKLDEFSGTIVKPSTSPVESLDIQGIFVQPMSHIHDFIDGKAPHGRLHQFASNFDCHYLLPSRKT